MLSTLISSSRRWPRMPPGQQNPFQNAPGPFIPALPNLAATCPSSDLDTVLPCSFFGGSNASSSLLSSPSPSPSPAPASNRPSEPESGEPPSSIGPVLSTKGEDGVSDTDLSLPSRLGQSAAPLSLFEENHFDLGVDSDEIRSSSPTESNSDSEKQQKQESQTSELSTSAQSSPTESEFQEGPKEGGDGDEGDEGKEKKRKSRSRGGRRNGRNRWKTGVESIPPRFKILQRQILKDSGTSLSDLRNDQLKWQSQCAYPLPPPPPPPPPPMNSGWSYAVHYPSPYYGGGGFVMVIPPPPVQFWNPMPVVPATSFPVVVPVSS